jgi:hypothetical protein
MTRRIWVVGGLIAVAALAAALVAGMATSSHSTAKGTMMVAAKADSNSWADKAGVGEGPASTYEAEQAALRAYPGNEIPLSALQNSLNTAAQLEKAAGHKSGKWMQLGPTQRAKYPAFLDQFLGGGKDYIASGRVTALAINNDCTQKSCRLYLGAAGGGVWTTDNALQSGGNMNWQFITGSLNSNAIGSILIDPSDPSGNTVYVGTGEPNAAVDNEAGVGIYKSTDAGQTWTFVPGSDVFNQRAVGALALDNQGRLLAGVAGAVRGVCQTSQGCALSSASTTHPLAIRGLYRQTGATFTRVFTSALASGAATRGVVQVQLDPNTPTTIYLSSFQQGVWRSTSNGDPGTWTQIKSALDPALNTDRATFALNVLPGNKTRMYVGIGNSSTAAADLARLYRTDDAGGAATFTDITNGQSLGWCSSFAAGAQCWYDNVVYSPMGSPDDVYLGGSYDYDRVHGQNNGRALILSTDAGATWHDMTLDKNNDGWLHPDHHALVTVPGNPLMWIDGNDGGVARSNGKYVDGSKDCNGRGLSPSDLATCQTFLSMIPDQTTSLNNGLSTLQFQSLSVDPAKPLNKLMGGTQDNGTFQFNGGPAEWPQVIYGDGGQSGFNAADGKLQFNSFAGQASDVNFRNGDPRKWVVATGPIVSSPEGSLFYPPLIADPSETFAGSIFSGSQSVWRTQDWGGDQSFLEANCSEFTTSSANPSCGDYVRIGAPGATDITGTAYGADAVPGDLVAALSRASQNTGTLWAATTTGRLLISDNANAPAASVTWQRLDRTNAGTNPVANAPRRDITQIAVDPSDANTAYVAYSGYNVNTPAQPGHVFRVHRTGTTATWTDLSFNLDDLPVNGIALDSQTGDLYAGTDFGVMMLPAGTTTWMLAAPGMPTSEITMLNIVPDSRVLYASTHGFGAWVLYLSGSK